MHYLLLTRNCFLSSLVRYLVQEFKEYNREIYCLNDTTSTCPYKLTTWDTVRDLKFKILVVEDVVGINARKYEVLNHILTWMVHHVSITPCYVICHSILRTKIHSLLGSFTHIYVAADPSSAQSFKRILSYYSYEEHEKKEYIRRLNNCSKAPPYAHFRFTVSTRKVELLRFPYVSPESVPSAADDEDRVFGTGLMDDIQKKRSDRQKDAIAFEKSRRFLSVGPVLKDKDKSDTALAIFDLIWPGLPRDRVNAQNLTITLKKASGLKTDNEVVISLIDFICCLVQDGNVEPSPINRQFHKFVTATKKIKIPEVFIYNSYFHE